MHGRETALFPLAVMPTNCWAGLKTTNYKTMALMHDLFYLDVTVKEFYFLHLEPNSKTLQTCALQKRQKMRVDSVVFSQLKPTFVMFVKGSKGKLLLAYANERDEK